MGNVSQAQDPVPRGWSVDGNDPDVFGPELCVLHHLP